MCENGCKGLSEFEKYHDEIALILTDIDMPIMNGIEFLKIIQEKIQCPIFVISGREDLMLDIKFTKFYEKPFNTMSLVNDINFELKKSA